MDVAEGDDSPEVCKARYRTLKRQKKGRVDVAEDEDTSEVLRQGTVH